MGNSWSLQLHREYNYSQIIRKRNWQRRGNFGFADMAGPGEPGTSRNWHFQWMGFFWSVLIVLTRYSELFAALFKLYVDLLSITTPEWSIEVFKHLNYLTELHWKTTLQRPPWKHCFKILFVKRFNFTTTAFNDSIKHGKFCKFNKRKTSQITILWFPFRQSIRTLWRLWFDKLWKITF